MVRIWSHRDKTKRRQLRSKDGLTVVKVSVMVRRWSHRDKTKRRQFRSKDGLTVVKVSVTVKRWSHREKEGVSAGCGCSEQSGGAVVVGAACLVLHEIKLEVLGVAHERRVGQHAVVGEASREGYGRRQLGCPRVQGSKFKVQGFIELFAPGG